MSMLSLYYGDGECGTSSGSVLVVPSVHCFFFSTLVRGDISGAPRSTDRNHVATSRGRHGSAYPCTAGSGGICIVWCVPARAAGGRGYATCIVTFLAYPWFLRNVSTYSARASPPSCCTELGYLY